jgi:hypothetical protein
MEGAVMWFDRFDILSAYYLFGSLYHGGQFTKEYAYIGRALKCGFKPGPSFDYQFLSDNGQAIFGALVGKDNEAEYLAERCPDA